MNLPKVQLLSSISLVALILSATASAQSGPKIVLHGSSGTVDIPLQGMARNEESVRLANRIQQSQKSLAQWRGGPQSNAPSAQRLSDIVANLQDGAIRDLGEGYQTVSRTSGKFPESKKSDIEMILDFCDKLLSPGPNFQSRVQTHISTQVPGATLHFKAYGSASDDWSTYSDGETMDIGAYYFRVSGANITSFQELVKILDNPTTHQIAP